MHNKYNWLTKEILEKDYSEFGNFKLIGLKYNIPRSTIERYCKILGVKTNAKISYTCDDDFFSKDNEDSFYLAGFIAADGCIYQHKCKEPNSIIITLSEKDKNHLILLKNKLNFNGPITNSINRHSKSNINWKDTTQSRFAIYSKKIIYDLKRFNIGQRKSLIYNMPDWLINHPLVNHFLRGYVDGDGSFFILHEKRKTKTKGISIYSKFVFGLRGTNEFLYSFKNILDRHNITTMSIPKFNNGIDELKYSGNIQVAKIANFLYKDATIMLQRKFDIVKGLL